MLYAILCYDSEDVVGAWSKAKDDEVMASLGAVQGGLAAQGRLGPVARLLPTTAATTIRKGREALVIDGPEGPTLYVGTVVRTEGGVELRDLRGIAPSLSQVVDVAWSDSETLPRWT